MKNLKIYIPFNNNKKKNFTYVFFRNLTNVKLMCLNPEKRFTKPVRDNRLLRLNQTTPLQKGNRSIEKQKIKKLFTSLLNFGLKK